MMFAAMEAVPGQAVFTGSTAWPVPSGVFKISMVCVQPGGTNSATEVAVDGVVVCRALNWGRIGQGGGEGGWGAAPYDDGYARQPGGGGGAGGYMGNGGKGGVYGFYDTQGSGGGGDGGNTVGGLGVGLRGLGSAPGSDRNGYIGGSYGGGSAGVDDTSPGSMGGACAWVNDVAVTPGQQVQVTVPAVLPWSLQGAGAVRIMWGGDRSYPNNAGDL